MKTLATAGLAVVALVLGGVALLSAEDAPPQMPVPDKAHEWLKQLVGEWEGEGECIMDASQPPTKLKGAEVTRSLGGFWVISETTFSMDGMEKGVTGVMTLGYDPATKKYIGTWVDSCGSHMWKYDGSLDATGKILTLEAEGPSMTTPGKMCKFKDVIEIKSADHKTLSSYIQGDDGKWSAAFMTVQYRRKK